MTRRIVASILDEILAPPADEVLGRVALWGLILRMRDRTLKPFVTREDIDRIIEQKRKEREASNDSGNPQDF